MPKTAATLFSLLILATTSSSALAQSLSWRLSEAAGAVSIRRGAETKRAVREAVLAPGDTVVSGPGGRAVLVHGRDFVTVSANSRVTIPLVEDASGFTRILQDLGNAIFRIEKLKVPHFGVKTPYLAAVVKGTTFSVTVDASGTSLQVVEGAVEVATLDGGAKDIIRPGAVATIGAADLFRLQVQGDGSRTIDSPARPSDAPGTTGGIAPAASTQVTSAPDGPVDAPSTSYSAGSQVVSEAISSKPIDLASMTGGLMTGSTAAVSAAVVASVKLETPSSAPSQSAEAPSTSPAAPTAATTLPNGTDAASASPAPAVLAATAPIAGGPGSADPKIPPSPPAAASGNMPVLAGQASPPGANVSKDAANVSNPVSRDDNPGSRAGSTGPGQAEPAATPAGTAPGDRPGVVTDPGKPVGLAISSGPGAATGPGAPADPSIPIGVDLPVRPGVADVPMPPTNPAKPDGPDLPIGPDATEGPGSPNDPANVDGLGLPVGPGAVDGPGAPVDPVKPDGPDLPIGPDLPEPPVPPVEPGKPDIPVGPGAADGANPPVAPGNLDGVNPPVAPGG